MPNWILNYKRSNLGAKVSLCTKRTSFSFTRILETSFSKWRLVGVASLNSSSMYFHLEHTSFFWIDLEPCGCELTTTWKLFSSWPLLKSISRFFKTLRALIIQILARNLALCLHWIIILNFFYVGSCTRISTKYCFVFVAISHLATEYSTVIYWNHFTFHNTL